MLTNYNVRPTKFATIIKQGEQLFVEGFLTETQQKMVLMYQDELVFKLTLIEKLEKVIKIIILNFNYRLYGIKTIEQKIYLKLLLLEKVDQIFIILMMVHLIVTFIILNKISI